MIKLIVSDVDGTSMRTMVTSLISLRRMISVIFSE